MKFDSQKKEAQRLFDAKLKRRRELARLPFEKKILILIQLQKIAQGLPLKRGEVKTRVWNVRFR